MALVALMVFSTSGFMVAAAGLLGFGLSFGAAFGLYLGMALLGPALLIPLARLLWRSSGGTPPGMASA